LIISTELKIISDRICNCIIRLDSLRVFNGIRLKLKIIFEKIININNNFNPPNKDPRRLLSRPKYTNFTSFVNPLAIKIIAEYDIRKIKIKTIIFIMSKSILIVSSIIFEIISSRFIEIKKEIKIPKKLDSSIISPLPYPLIIP
tara:strand:- start:266 stop:697 length:432 start_codon:yes stop_codon:yes gene_type:complete